MKIAIVHEMFIKLWGAEKIIENWLQIYPDADIFTLIYDEKVVGKTFPKHKIHPHVFKTRTQKVYTLTKNQRFCLPFMSSSIESFDFSSYDIVLVSSSGFAHGVITKPETKTIIYYHSPARYMWDWTNEYKRDIWAQTGIKGYILNSLFLKFRQWDYIASTRHDITLANSKNTARRIQKYYKKDSQVLYPPIETERFAKKMINWINEKPSNRKTPKKYYIILSTLTEFKRLDIALSAFTKLPDVNLIIIGEWDQRKELELASSNSQNISLVWAKYGDELVSLVQKSLGLIFPGEEDFGIVPIEVMAAGKPVFALWRWWLTETVIPWETWEFFRSIEGEDFLREFQKFHKNNISWEYTSKACKKQAQKFDKTKFEREIIKLIEDRS